MAKAKQVELVALTLLSQDGVDVPPGAVLTVTEEAAAILIKKGMAEKAPKKSKAEKDS